MTNQENMFQDKLPCPHCVCLCHCNLVLWRFLEKKKTSYCFSWRCAYLKFQTACFDHHVSVTTEQFGPLLVIPKKKNNMKSSPGFCAAVWWALCESSKMTQRGLMWAALCSLLLTLTEHSHTLSLSLILAHTHTFSAEASTEPERRDCLQLWEPAVVRSDLGLFSPWLPRPPLASSLHGTPDLATKQTTTTVLHGLPWSGDPFHLQG